MHPYKVIYLDSTFLKKTSGEIRKGNLDGLTTANSLEALIVEQDKEGYDLFCINPVPGMVVVSPYTITTATGFMVTFKEKSIE